MQVNPAIHIAPGLDPTSISKITAACNQMELLTTKLIKINRTNEKTAFDSAFPGNTDVSGSDFRNWQGSLGDQYRGINARLESLILDLLWVVENL